MSAVNELRHCSRCGATLHMDLSHSCNVDAINRRLLHLCDIEIGQREVIARRIEQAVAAEREACAKIAEDWVSEFQQWSDGSDIAAAIRARGKAE